MFDYPLQNHQDVIEARRLHDEVILLQKQIVTLLSRAGQSSKFVAGDKVQHGKLTYRVLSVAASFVGEVTLYCVRLKQDGSEYQHPQVMLTKYTTLYGVASEKNGAIVPDRKLRRSCFS